MAKKYSPEFNKEISKVVKNFNAKRNRAIKQGYRNIPEAKKVSELKARYTSKAALESQLKQLRKFTGNRGYNVLEKVENKGGAEAIKWEWGYLKSNVKQAREFFKQEYDLINSKIGDFPGERMRADAIQAKLNILDLDVDYMSQEQFRSFRATIYQFINRPKVLAAGYRGFLREVDAVMGLVGIEEKERKKFFNKVNTLTPEQFHYFYETSDLVSRVYDLADSPELVGGIKLNTSEENARDLIDALMEEIDELIEEAKDARP